MIWSYGITTVSARVKDGMLDKTLLSLLAAGFDSPRVLVDQGKSHIINWQVLLLELTRTKADRYVVFQDDVIACRNLRRYLDETIIPSKGWLNLITFDCNVRTNTRGWYLSKYHGKGAQGLVFDEIALESLLRSPVFADPTKLKGRQKSIDGMVSMSLRPSGYREYVHYPSLLQHTSKRSTLGDAHTRLYGPVKAWQEGYDPCG